jgi:uncharacterized protein
MSSPGKGQNGVVHETRQSPDERNDQFNHLGRFATNASVAIPMEVFEKMYLSPQNNIKGELRKTFGNPTPM